MPRTEGQGPDYLYICLSSSGGVTQAAVFPEQVIFRNTRTLTLSAQESFCSCNKYVPSLVVATCAAVYLCGLQERRWTQ